MKPFWALLKVNFKSLLLTSVNLGRGKRKAASGIGAFAIMAGLMLFLSSTYSFMLAAQTAPFGRLDIMLMYMLTMAIIAPLVFTFYAAQSLVFSTKDVDLVLSLPVSGFKVMMARIMALYLEVLLITEALLVPTGIAYAVYNGAGGVYTVFALLVLGLFLALLPTLVGLVCGFVISWFVARTRFKNLVNIVLSLLFFGLIMAGSMGISGAAANLQTQEQINAIKVGAPISWVIDVATKFNPLWFLLLAAACTLPFLLVAWLFSLNFKNLLTALASTTLKTNYKLGQLKTTGVLAALFKKEAAKYFGTPILVMNSLVSVILLVGAGVVAVFNRAAIVGVFAEMGQMGITGIEEMLAPLALATIAFFVSVIPVSCVSVSLEGKTLWILKEAPVPVSYIFMVKAGFNFLLAGPTCVACGILFGVAFAISPAEVAGVIVVSVLLSALASMLGLFINLQFPRMDADSDAVVVKQSTSVIISMLANWVVAGLLAGVYLLVRLATPSFLLFALVASVVLAGLIALATLMLNTKGRRLFNAL
ncbi:hypothetical protein LJC61_08100 [Ruminococcaceae bacterium OttesenSCG-928-A16]|nr:hypothetical protein [Ruminococcaceae bacterium OttesenSCG-928-A16]